MDVIFDTRALHGDRELNNDKPALYSEYHAAECSSVNSVVNKIIPLYIQMKFRDNSLWVFPESRVLQRVANFSPLKNLLALVLVL